MSLNLYLNPTILIVLSLLGSIAILLWNRNLRREIQRYKTLSLMDNLTSLPNRRGFDLLMLKGIREARRSKQPLSLMLLNLDSFSSVNLKYGFDIGDALLERVARRLKELQPNTNVPCRWSGDEFIILLKNMEHIAARWSAEKMRSNIEQEIFKIDGRDVHITASLSTATLNDSDDHTSILQRAHHSLINAKKSGGNTCCCMDEM